jgi:hypothetical protein
MSEGTISEEVGNNFQEIGRTLLTFSVESVSYDSIRYSTGIVRPAGGHNQNLWESASHDVGVHFLWVTKETFNQAHKTQIR